MSKKVSARLSAPRDFDRAFYLLKVGGNRNNAGDSLPLPGGTTKRISAARARQIGDLLSNRDREVLELLSIVGMATGDQIRRLLWGEGSSAARSARRQLAKLTALRVLSRIDQRIGGVRSGSGGYAYVLDVVGQHLSAPEGRRRRAPTVPGLMTMAHGLAVSECYVALRILARSRTIELIHFEGEPGCWRYYYGLGGVPRTLKPDAFVITASDDWEDRWFLEIDRSTERPIRIKAKAESYVEYWVTGREQTEHGVFPRILWVAPNDHRVSELVNVLASLPADHWPLFQVTSDASFSSLILSGAGEQEGEK